MNRRLITIGAIVWLMAVAMCSRATAQAGDEAWMDWRERMKLLNYTPRYFGPNAFPYSELTDGPPAIAPPTSSPASSSPSPMGAQA